MKNRLRHMWWRLVGRPDLPPKRFKIVDKINQYTGKPYIPRYQYIAILYQSGLDIGFIAESLDVTRERVRQCLWKAYWEIYRGPA